MFIRTKDGIYESTGKPNAISITNNVLYYCWDEDGENEIIIRDDEIIKQADTIKELIDQYVFICEDVEKPQLVIPMNFDYCKNTFKHTIIYGAIWISGENDEPILKSVAKMNNEEKLVLI